MKKNRVRIGIFLLFFIFLLGASNVNVLALQKNTADNKLELTVDSHKKAEMPKRFRKTSDKIKTEGKMPNLTGLAELDASGSQQFTPGNINLVKDAIGKDKKISVVDLRQESHGFINHLAVSWKLPDSNKANKGLTRDQVIKEEKKLLKSIKLNQPVQIKNKTVIPVKVQSEKELVKDSGMDYIRVTVTDTERPEDDMVDYFVKKVRKLPEDTWLHFHCKAGMGRTTTFMAMYDMMKNSKKVSLEDIMERQELLGGVKLLKPVGGKESESQKRSDFLRQFYQYTKENNDNFKTSWSQWLKSK